MAERNRKSLQVEVRRGTLPGGIGIQLETWTLGRPGDTVILTYLGTEDALIAAGCLTTSMIDNRAAKHRGGRSQFDEHGKWFRLHRAPTKASPRRMKLRRCAVPKIAMGMPGVRELFPEGIPEPASTLGAPELVLVQSEPQSKEPAAAGPETAAEWREQQLDDMESNLRYLKSWNGNHWRGLGKFASPRFRLADDEISRLDSILHRFRSEVFEALEQAVVVDNEAPEPRRPRPSFLRMVVDNEA